MPCNPWIKQYVKGKSFVDVGGLWNTVNERVSVAAKAGAAEVTMIDGMEKENDWWGKFYDRCKQAGVACGKSIVANVDEPEFYQKAGTYDVVHCSGIIYHCPNPLYSVSQLAKITNEHLILGTTRMPDTLTNKRGTIKMEPGSALFVPALNETQRAVLGEFLEEVGGFAYGITRPTEWEFKGYNLKNYDPWWYMFTDRHIENLLNVCGFEVLDSASAWEGRSKYFLSKKVKVTNAPEATAKEVINLHSSNRNGNAKPTPRVSIIIPAYNQARFLRQAIESALGQTQISVEVIVVNDGSTDETPEVIAAYQSDPRFKSVTQANAGLPAARNRGLAEATGEYLCFLDSDDFYTPDKCAKQAAILDAKPEIGFVYCDITTVDEAGNPKPEQSSIGQNQRTLSGEIFPALIMAGYFPPHTVMIRRKILEAVGNFDPTLGGNADYDLWLRASARCKAEYQDEKLAAYRDWGNSMSKNLDHMDETRCRTLQKAARLHPELAGDGLNRLQKATGQLFRANQQLNRELFQTMTRVPAASARKRGDQNYSLLMNLPMGQVTQGKPEQSALWDVVMNGQPSKALLLQPPVELSFEMPTNAAGVFTAEITIHPDAWEKPEAGACEFQVQIDRRLAFAIVIDPTKAPADRCWHPVQIDVPKIAGGKHQIVLRTRSIGRPDYRWALWRNPQFAWKSVTLETAPTPSAAAQN